MVLGADEPVHLYFLVDPEKVVIYEEIQCCKREEQKKGVKPCKGSRSAVVTGKYDGCGKSGEIYSSAFSGKVECHGGFSQAAGADGSRDFDFCEDL